MGNEPLWWYNRAVSETVNTAALLLRSVDYREADRIVTLLTEQRGCLGAIARGARSSRRRFAGALEPFALLEVEVVPPRTDGLWRLQSARVVRGYLGILSQLQRMNGAGAALGVLRDLLVEAPAEPGLFDETVALLQQLDACPLPRVRPIRLAYLARILALSGWEPDLSACGYCQRVPRKEQAAEFDPVAGHLVCRACGGGPMRVSARARWALIAMSHQGLTGEPLVDPGEDDLFEEVDRVLAALIRCHVGR